MDDKSGRTTEIDSVRGIWRSELERQRHLDEVDEEKRL